jgi:Uma2 family endonuclease
MSIAVPPKPTETTPAAGPTLADLRYRLTIDRYYRMIGAGIFAEDDPIFLWRGQLVTKMTKNPPHVIALTSTYQSLIRAVPVGWYVQQEQPVVIAGDSVPEPDVAVVRGALRDYASGPPTAKQVALIVEVANTSLAIDRGEMLESYAAQAVPVYWIVNLPDRRVEVYTQPTGPADRPFYRESRLFGPEDMVPVILDGREVGRVAVRDLLP